MNENSTKCWFCGAEMIWGSDDDFEDCGILGSGIVANLRCPNCNATAEFCTVIEEDKISN